MESTNKKATEINILRRRGSDTRLPDSGDCFATIDILINTPPCRWMTQVCDVSLYRVCLPWAKACVWAVQMPVASEHILVVSV